MEAAAVFLVVASPFAGRFAATAAHAWPDWSQIGRVNSGCGGCGRTLSPFELAPILGYAVQGGRCACRRSRILRARLAGEVLAVMIALAAVLMLPAALAIPAVMFGWVLLFASLVDLRTMELPDVATLGLVPFGLAAAWLRGGEPALVASLLAAAGGFAVLAAAGWFYRRLRGRDGLGAGDMKLLAAAGAWSVPAALPWIIAGASAVTLLAIMAARRAGKPVSASSEVPFGPGLALAAFAAHMAVSFGGL